ncbi:MAG: sulfur carrier protein ThiS [Sulfuricella sp.]|nr:sulfur carrier protein ThiS [Sulfuricella sp.]MBS4099186.1 sulfur carrier protein ThiS [Sulfuricella sp.]
MKTTQFTVNGESHSFATAPTLAQLLEHLDLTGKRLAVELNGEIAPRSRHGEIVLADNDKLEIVVAVGGG